MDATDPAMYTINFGGFPLTIWGLEQALEILRVRGAVRIVNVDSKNTSLMHLAAELIERADKSKV